MAVDLGASEAMAADLGASEAMGVSMVDINQVTTVMILILQEESLESL